MRQNRTLTDITLVPDCQTTTKNPEDSTGEKKATNRITTDTLLWVLRICNQQVDTITTRKKAIKPSLARTMPKSEYLAALTRRTNPYFFTNLKAVTQYIRGSASNIQGLKRLKEEVKRQLGPTGVPAEITEMIEFGFTHLEDRRAASETQDNVTQLRPTAV